PVRITHAQATYPVLPDPARSRQHEVISIDRVWRVRQGPQGEQQQEFPPFYALRHRSVDKDRAADGEGRYWYARRDDTVADLSPGHETEIGLVDVDFNPVEPFTDTLSIEVTASNRDLPASLSIGQPGGDLTQDGGSVARQIRLLTHPTRSARFARGEGALWRLVSQLSVNHLALSGGGLDALKEVLTLHDLERSVATRRLIEGLLAIESEAATAWVDGKPFATLARGTRVKLTVDESAFAGSGLRLFAQVLDEYLGLHAHLNSFVELQVWARDAREPLFTLPRRGGAGPLL
ncbi:MAG: type VI secretion system baseplate subunit TssF, partial [Rubrivivax sp.]